MKNFNCAFDFKTLCGHTQDEILADKTICAKCLAQQVSELKPLIKETAELKNTIHRRNNLIADLRKKIASRGKAVDEWEKLNRNKTKKIAELTEIIKKIHLTTGDTLTDKECETIESIVKQYKKYR